MTYDELVEKARELGVAIQDTDEFTAFIVAKTAADKSEKLQDKLGQFNLKKLDLNRAIIAEEKDISLQFRGSRNQRIIDMDRSRQAGKIVLWDKLRK